MKERTVIKKIKIATLISIAIIMAIIIFAVFNNNSNNAYVTCSVGSTSSEVFMQECNNSANISNVNSSLIVSNFSLNSLLGDDSLYIIIISSLSVLLLIFLIVIIVQSIKIKNLKKQKTSVLEEENSLLLENNINTENVENVVTENLMVEYGTVGDVVIEEYALELYDNNRNFNRVEIGTLGDDLNVLPIIDIDSEITVTKLIGADDKVISITNINSDLSAVLAEKARLIRMKETENHVAVEEKEDKEIKATRDVNAHASIQQVIAEMERELKVKVKDPIVDKILHGKTKEVVKKDPPIVKKEIVTEEVNKDDSTDSTMAMLEERARKIKEKNSANIIEIIEASNKVVVDEAAISNSMVADRARVMRAKNASKRASKAKELKAENEKNEGAVKVTALTDRQKALRDMIGNPDKLEVASDVDNHESENKLVKETAPKPEKKTPASANKKETKKKENPPVNKSQPTTKATVKMCDLAEIAAPSRRANTPVMKFKKKN